MRSSASMGNRMNPPNLEPDYCTHPHGESLDCLYRTSSSSCRGWPRARPGNFGGRPEYLCRIESQQVNSGGRAALTRRVHRTMRWRRLTIGNTFWIGSPHLAPDRSCGVARKGIPWVRSWSATQRTWHAPERQRWCMRTRHRRAQSWDGASGSWGEGLGGEKVSPCVLLLLEGKLLEGKGPAY